MHITLDHPTPQDNQIRLFGTFDADGETGSFSCPIVYNNGVMDLETTETRTKLTIEESFTS